MVEAGVMTPEQAARAKQRWLELTGEILMEGGLETANTTPTADGA